MPTLPISRVDPQPRRIKRRGARAGSGAVDIIPPSSSRVGALNAPVGAFETTLGIGAGEVGPALFEAGERLRQTEIKVKDHEDTNDRVRIVADRKAELSKSRETFFKEPKFQREGSMIAHGTQVTDENEAIVLAFIEGGATDKAAARLTTDLINLQSVDTALVSTAAATASDAETEKSFSDFNTTAGAEVVALPTQNTLLDVFEKLDGHIIAMGDNLNDEQKETHRQKGREGYIDVAVTTLINSGLPGSLSRAEGILTDEKFLSGLSAPKHNALVDKLQKAQAKNAAAKDTFGRKIAGIELEIGRTIPGFVLTTDQKLAIAGLPIKTKSKLEKDVKTFTDSGVEPDRALGLASGQIIQLPADDFGDIYEFNLLTGVRKFISGPVGKPPADGSIEPDKQPIRIPTQETALGQAVFRGAGVVSNIKTGIANTLGQGVPGGAFAETTDADQEIKLFNLDVKKAFSNNPRFPVAEMAIILELLPTGSALKDPDTALRDLEKMRIKLEDRRAAKEKALFTRITSKRRGELRDEISTIDEITTLMDKPLLPEGIPAGSTLVEGFTTPSGNPAWRGRDGVIRGAE